MSIVAPDVPAGIAGPRCRPTPWSLDHPQLLALDRDLPPDHLARQIDAAVARLDLGPLFARYGGTGSPPHPPELLLRAVLFATRRGRHRPADWHRDAAESGPVRWLLRGCRPARSCWYAFRDRVAPLLDGLNQQVLGQARTAGLTPAARGALDGTLIAANASRHKLANEDALQQRAALLAAAAPQAQDPGPKAAVPAAAVPAAAVPAAAVPAAAVPAAAVPAAAVPAAAVPAAAVPAAAVPAAAVPAAAVPAAAVPAAAVPAAAVPAAAVPAAAVPAAAVPAAAVPAAAVPAAAVPAAAVPAAAVPAAAVPAAAVPAAAVPAAAVPAAAVPAAAVPAAAVPAAAVPAAAVPAAAVPAAAVPAAAVPAAAVPAAAPAVPPPWLAPTPRGRQGQQRRLRQAQAHMAQRQQRNGQKRASKRQKRERIVVSVSDPEAALGRDKDGVYRPLYNVQVLDDLDSAFVLAYDVFAQPNDAGVLGPMLARARQLAGQAPRQLLADSAYAGGADLAAAAAAGVTLYAPWQANDYSAPAEGQTKQIPKEEFRWLAEGQTYVCPQGHRLEYQGPRRQKRSGTEAVVLQQYRCPPAHCSGCPLQPRCTPNPQAGRTISRGQHEELIEALRACMATDEAKALYRWRRQTVELVNADWKQHRQVRRFSGRGLARARGQVGLTVLAHNLLTLQTEEAKAKVKASKAPP